MSPAAYPGFDTRPREGHLRVLSPAGAKVHAGEYVSKNIFMWRENKPVLKTADSVTDALKVRIAPTRNPGVIEVLNSPYPDFKFLGVAMNRDPNADPFSAGAWGAVSLVSSPNEVEVKSAFQAEGPVKGAGWFVGSGGELVFHWDHTDGFVYTLRHSVEFPSHALYDMAHFQAYFDYYFKGTDNKAVEVKIIFEPLDQVGL